MTSKGFDLFSWRDGRHRGAMAVIVVGCVVLAACSNGDDDDSADTQDTSPVVTEDTALEDAADEPEATDVTELDTEATPSE